ncbi:MAG: crotonase/enoyl-CoA hydratase family protein [Parvibaculum sp.]|uniref:crotonase/enoyl-CoA hydratase family protein n=1 Tax=Parvibaculum sp. TaxID=2024848 RepID=UPI0027287DD6|nr:crotonase/enoyl-CoA hydratase family protein [Parvibaculum sp.]MDO8838620.1 crotonase/enoyl-CoA hydratase family protein [Parvibaculum sp.]
MKTYTCFDVSIENKIAHIVLSRPEKMNAMNREFWRELPEIVREIDQGALARVIVISSTGKHFTAGMDLSVFTSGPDTAGQETGRLRANLMQTVLKLQQTFGCLDEARMPVLMAVQGGCIVGGVDFASACDLRYCSTDAFFCIHEINIGMTSDVGTFPRLPHLMPQGLVRELAYTGRRLFADEAKSCGLVNAVFDTQAEMMEAVMGIARDIAARSPLAVHGSKEMINYARDHSIADGLKHIAVWQTGMFQPADMTESFTAKAEKREPAFDDLLPVRDAI